MNILMLTNTYTPHIGGVARSVESFTAAYRKLGHRVVVVTPSFEAMPYYEDDVVRVPAIQHFNGSDFSVPMPIPGYLRSMLQELQPDIVHSHHPFLLGDTALRTRAIHSVPVVFTHHTQYEQYTHYLADDSPTLKRFVADLVTGYCKLCDAIIAPSESIAADLRGQGVATRIEVIPTGIDVEHFASGNGHDFRVSLNIPATAFVVGHVGRLAAEKNLEFLTEAVAEFLKRNKRACYLVVGSGPAAEHIERIFAERGLSCQLYLAGSVQGAQLADAYQAMDVFAFASQSETQGLVLAEAMAAGVPVVAVDAPGVREVIVDRQNGCLLPGEDAASFATALQWIAGSPRSRQRSLSAAARRSAENFSIQHCAAQALALYESVITNAPYTNELPDSGWSTALRFIDEEWRIMGTKVKAVGTALRKSDVTAGISQ
ncbi:MAG: glycosyltransferase [Gammaproteobacteria bacterium]